MHHDTLETTLKELVHFYGIDIKQILMSVELIRITPK